MTAIRRLSALALAGLVLVSMSACAPERARISERAESTSATQSGPAPSHSQVTRGDPNDQPGVDPDDFVKPVFDGLEEPPALWFSNPERTVRCIMYSENYPGDPRTAVQCDLMTPFPVAPTAEQEATCKETAGSWQGNRVTLLKDGVVLGGCQSDVPIGQMCAHEPDSDYCRNNWMNVPRVWNRSSIDDGRFHCAVQAGFISCWNRDSPDSPVLTVGHAYASDDPADRVH